MTTGDIEDLYPLSPMQQGMLYHTLYAPKSGVYVEQNNFAIYGNLDFSAFAWAWQRAIDRHPILRTAFVWEDLGQPLQAVFRQMELPLGQQDWRELAPPEQETRLAALRENDRIQGFDLSTLPLTRLTLIRVAEDAYQCVWSYHHILLDGWSGPMLLKEILTSYEAFCRGQDVHLERPRPYRDYIAWLQRQDLSQAETFWRERLQGFTSPTPLGVDRTLDGVSDQKENYAERGLDLSRKTTAALQSLAQQHRLTLNTLTLGAWALILSRYSGEQDVVFGATSSGRPAELSRVESMMGLFINTLPMRVQVSSQAQLLPWLEGLQTQQARIRQYEYSPLVRVQGWSEVPRSLPLFESILVFENAPTDTSLWEWDGILKIRHIRSFSKTNFALTVVVSPATELLLKVMYDGNRFEAAAISRMLGHFQTLLEGILTNPNRRLADVGLLTDAERHQLLAAWNDTEIAYPHDRCVHELFETQVEQTPDAAAVVFEDHHLTYRELNRRANQLAHRLQELGVGPEVRVGVCAERSLEMVVGLLSILKAGGAYVPLEPAYPKERLAFMLADAQVSALLVQAHLVERLDASRLTLHSSLITLDADWATIARANEENPLSSVTPDNLAYVIYTSGSTGKPKGTSVLHRGVVNYLTWCQRAYPVETGMGAPVHSPISFDLTVTGLFVPLTVGRTIHLLPEGQGVEVLSEALRQGTDFSFVKITPAHLKLLSQQLSPEEAAGRTHAFIIGGENLLAEQIVFWQDFASDTMLVNEYGPTEAVVGCCVYRVPKGERGQGSVPIGYPITNAQIYLLDSRLQPVPPGVTGELHIGGVGLARGYLNRPELTAAAFIPDSFGGKAGARLYKSGDLARHLPDGNVEFLGRIDQQVKIRGFRIELGEIESVLEQHSKVRAAAVLAREDEPGDKRLVAYVVAANEQQQPTDSELRRSLKEQLPDYMVPSAFVTLEALPLTPNGKVDRRALPVPDGVRPELETRYVPPQTEIEKQIAAMMQEILQVEQVGLYDNFFDLGGHSLLLLQLQSKLQTLFDRDIPIVQLFRYPTIRDLARHLSQTQVEKPALAHIEERGQKYRAALKRQRQQKRRSAIKADS